MAGDGYSNKSITNRVLHWLNDAFTYVFAVEMMVKLGGLGVKRYMRDEYNIFDGVLVLISMADMAFNTINSPDSGNFIAGNA